LIDTAIIFGYTAVSVSMLLCLYRLVRGPDLPDRIMAADTLYINAVGLIVLVGLDLRQSVYFEAAILIAVMGFVGTVAWCKHVIRGSIID